MTTTEAFSGSVLDSNPLVLGEGPSYDPLNGSLIWFNILERQMHELNIKTGQKSLHHLPFMASVYARIDDKRYLLASDEGLFIRDRKSGAFELHVELEADKPGNRSNDGRMHPSGALWIGTMGKKAEPEAGAIYHVAKGKVTKLFDKISIPNSICFTADGARGYYVDSAVNRIMTVALDAATGLPIAEPELFADRSDAGAGCDGAVCDADGNIWSAQWGASEILKFASDGTLLARYQVPPRQPSCPVFFGDNFERLGFTSAYENLDEKARLENPESGQTYELNVKVSGVGDAAYKL